MTLLLSLLVVSVPPIKLFEIQVPVFQSIVKLHFPARLNFGAALLWLLLTVSSMDAAEITSAGGYYTSPREERTNSHPFRIKGTVTYHDPVWNMLFLEENGTGFFSFPPTNFPALKQGSYVEIQGLTGVEDNFRARTIQVLSSSSGLKPLPITPAMLSTNSFPSRWIEFEMNVRSVRVANGKILITGHKGGILFEGSVQSFPQTNLVGLLESEVKIRGVLGQERLVGEERSFQVWIQSLSDITVTRVSNPFERPVLPISALDALKNNTVRPRVQIHGEVIEFTPGQMVIVKDHTGEVEARLPARELIFAGDRVALVGYPAPGTNRTRLTFTAFKVLPAMTQTTSTQPVSTDLPNLVYTNIGQIRALGPHSAALSNQVDVVCVVTHFQAPFVMFVHDGETGIYVSSKELFSGQAGDLIRLQGHVAPGDFAPIIQAQKITALGKGTMPTPKPATLETLLTGNEDSQWIRIHAVVEEIEDVSDSTIMTLATPAGRFTAEFPLMSRPPFELIDCQVSVEGAAGSLSNKRRQLRAIKVHASGMDSIRVMQKGPTNPFLLPVTPAGEIGRFTIGQNRQHRVHARGVVTYFEHGVVFYVQDETGALECRSRQTSGFAVGDVVDVTGFPEFARLTPSIRSAVARSQGPGQMPVPRELKPEQVRDPASQEQMTDGLLVTIQGEVLEQTQTKDGELLLLQAEGSVFQTLLRHSLHPGVARNLPEKGSLVSVQGICKVDVTEWQEPEGFTLLLRSRADVEVIENATWWTRQRTMRVLGALAIVISATIFWGTSLQRKVKEQTAQLRIQFDREFQLAELGKELNDVHDVRKAAGLVLRTAIELTGSSSASLHIRTQKGNCQRLTLSKTDAGATNDSVNIAFSDDLPEISSIRSDSPGPSSIRAPLRRAGEVFGVLQVEAKLDRHFTSDEAELLQTISDHSSAALNRIWAEEASRKDQERYQYVSKASHDAVWDWDIVNHQLLWNDQFHKLIGCPRESVTSDFSFWTERVHDEDRTRVVSSLEGTAAGAENFWSEEYRFRKDDGSWIYILDRGYIIRDSTGTATRMIGAMQDISTRKEAQLTLERARDAAENASRTKSEFLATMSHEIRTPMNGIIGMTNLLMDTPLSSEQKEFTETVRSSSEALLSIINDILDFSKIEAGKMELENSDFAIVPTIQGTMAVLSARAQSKKIDLRVMVGDDVPLHLKGDPGRLRQVLLNLLGNAVKFTEKGSVEVQVLVKSKTDQDCRLKFVVKDTGVGISEDAQKKLFKPFSQGDGSTSRKFGGTGLGLVISQNLAEMMGGSIDFTSKVGAGSTFTLELPFGLGSPPRTVAQVRPILPATTPSQRRILLAEDNPVNQRVALRQLQKMGYLVDLASNGLEVLKALGQAKYPLILMDCQMPELDGYQTTREIRALENSQGTPRVPIIALTADAMVGDRERCFEAGMDDYIPKPVKFEILQQVLQKHLPP